MSTDSIRVTPELTRPADRDTEAAVLGLAMVSAEAWRQASRLTPQDFSRDANRKIFQAMRRLDASGKPIDEITLGAELQQSGELATIGGRAYLTDLYDHRAVVGNIESYIRMLEKKANLREIMAIAELAVTQASDPSAEPEELRSDIQQRLGAIQSPYRLVVVNSEELLRREMPPRAKLLHPFLDEQGIAMIHAWRGVGKTFVALGIAIAVASGGTFARWQAPKPAGVLYVDGELPFSVLRDRTAALLAGADNDNLDPRFLRFITPDLQSGLIADLATSAGQMLLERELGDARLLVLDNLSALVRTGVENEAESWTHIQPWLLRLRQNGISTLFLHHSGKGFRQRGTSKKEDVLDTVIALRQTAEYDPQEGLRVAVHFEKNRGFYGDDAASFQLALITGPDGALTWTVKDLVDSKRARALALHEEGTSFKEIGKLLGISKTQAHRLVNGGKK